MGQDLSRHEAMVLGDEVAFERVFELRQLDAQTPLGEIGERFGVVVAGDELIEHRASRRPERLGRHARELDAGVLEHLVREAPTSN